MPTAHAQSARITPVSVSPASVLALLGGTPVSASTIPIASVKLTDEDINAAVAALRSGMLAQGKNCLALEEKFAAATGATYAFTCANGTCALQLAYEPLFDRGDEVLVPAWTYIATVSMVVARGGVPIFCDADPRTYNVDVADMARRVTPRTRAVAVTHLYGNPVDIDAVQTLAAKHKLKVIYDAAQAHMATWKGQGLGAFGDAVTYSFYPTKNMTTGEGGLVTTNDEALAREIKLLRSHGETQKYLHEKIGFNYRMTDVEAAVGLSQFARLPDITARRRAIARRLDQIIAHIPGLSAPTVTPGGESAYHLYPVRLDPAAFTTARVPQSVLDSLAPGAAGASVPSGSTPVEPGNRTPSSMLRDLFCKALNAEGVGTAIHYPRPVTRQPVFARHVNSGAGAASFPVADALAATLFCIPVHQALTDAQVEQIGESLNKVAAALRA